jgi:DNA-binding CsgD family transcriptional regulator
MNLTDLDKAILLCLAQGMQSKEIAASVGRKKPTIEGHIRLLLAKLNARTRAQLVANAMERGEITPSR